MASVCFHYFAVVSDDTAALRQTHTLNKHTFPHKHCTCWQAFVSIQWDINTHTPVQCERRRDLLTDILIIARVKLSCIWMQGQFLKAFLHTHTHCSTLKTGYNLMLLWHTQTLFDASIADLLISLERKIIWSR